MQGRTLTLNLTLTLTSIYKVASTLVFEDEIDDDPFANPLAEEKKEEEDEYVGPDISIYQQAPPKPYIYVYLDTHPHLPTGAT